MSQHPYPSDLMKIPYLEALKDRHFGFCPIIAEDSNQNPKSRSRSMVHRGLSLIEVMIALTMTLIVMGAMMTAFQSVSQSMQTGRAMIEMASRVRNVETTLRYDLGNLTVEPRPYTTTIPNGYFQIVEGPRTDLTEADRFIPPTPRIPPLPDRVTINSSIGDLDDTLSMTIQSKGRLFRGRFNGQIVESPLAEVVWFPVWNNPETQDGIPIFEEKFELRRRQLLVLPAGANPVLATNLDWNGVRRFFLDNDISARILPSLTAVNSYDIVANQLTDLAVRKNRFGHLPANDDGVAGAYLTWLQNVTWTGLPSRNTGLVNASPNGFPHQQHYKVLRALSSPLGLPLNLQRAGDAEVGIVLTDVVAFDVKVFSPNAHVRLDQDLTLIPQPVPDLGLEPGDFVNLSTAGTFPYVIPNPSGPGTIVVDSGVFVDLGFADLRTRLPVEPSAWFSGASSLVGNSWPFSTYPPEAAHTLLEFVFDTWTPAYESDGINQDGIDVVDQGTDGLDNDARNGVDDIGERETLPPYNNPVRGIEIRIRSIEKITKQVHQTTILQSFVPE